MHLGLSVHGAMQGLEKSKLHKCNPAQQFSASSNKWRREYILARLTHLTRHHAASKLEMCCP